MQAAPHRLSPKAHSLKKKNKTKSGSRAQFLRRSLLHANRNAGNVVTLGNGERPSSSRLKDEYKKEKPTHKP